ncbi:MAG: hypothetical protein DRQ24_09865 [Candidatus Latescibacterota bacterium]|nr:MAG: hypothetical protein DRQ24_09865 [Candidatus Latescibacterota bacterium]
MKIKILDVREIPSGEPGRIGKMDLIITYQVDALRTYITTMPKEEFTEERLKEKIKEELTEREKWLGKEIEI